MRLTPPTVAEALAVGRPGPTTPPGWRLGRPDWESNPELSLADKIGTFGTPGVYDQIAQQWYRLATLLRQSREEVRRAASELLPLDDETPEETRWNDAAWDLVHARLGVYGAADDLRVGWGEWLDIVHDADWWGCAITMPHWVEAAGDIETGVVGIDKLLLAAVTRFVGASGLMGPDQDGIAQVEYASESYLLNRIDYDRVLHVVPSGVAGQLFGEARLRSLLAPGLAWIQAMQRAGVYDIRASGYLTITAAQTTTPDDVARYVRRGNEFQSGLAAFAIEQHAESGEGSRIDYPSGSAPDFIGRMNALDAMADFAFASRNGSLYSSGSGSRAASETISEEDAAGEESYAEWIVGIAWRTMAGWLATQTGYAGRIRTVQIPRAESVDIQGVVTLSAAGVLRLTPSDQNTIRAAVGLPLLTDEQAAAAPARLSPDAPSPAAATEQQLAPAAPLPVGSLTAAVEIVARLRPTSPDAAPLAPDVAIELLTAAGLNRADAEAMVRAQLAAPSPEPLPAAAMSDGCGCDTCSAAMSDVPRFTVRDRDGRERPSWRDLLSVTIRGVTVQPEAHIAWMAEDERESERAAALAALLRPIMADHVAAVRRAAASGGDLDAVRLEYRARYADAIRASVGTATAQAVAEIEAAAAAQLRLDLPDVVGPVSVSGPVAAMLTRADALAAAAADAMAGRVQTDAAVMAVSGRTEPRVTPEGLAREANGADRAAASAARLEAAAANAPPGLEMIGAVVSSMRDGLRVCPPCRERDGTTFLFPRDEEKFVEYARTYGPPNLVECLGGSACRCWIVPIFGRRVPN